MPIQYRDSYPFWFYKKILLADRGVSLPPQYIFFDLKNGFDYWIRGLFISYPHAIHVAGPDDVSPDLYLSLIQSERNRNITEIPIPVDLFTNPGSKKPTPPGHQQHDRQFHGGYIRWNYLISNSDVIKIKIDGHNNGNPGYIRLCVMGHNVKAGQ